MRCNQVSISVEQFGKYVPKDYPADVRRIHVYCDDFKSIYAALSKAYAMVIDELAEYEKIGVRTDIYTNEFSREDFGGMYNATFEPKTKYEEDVNLQYGDTCKRLYQDLIWAYEHSEEIMKVIKQSKDADSMKEALMDRFSLNAYQAKKLSQIRLEMLTEKEYRSWQEEIKQMEVSRDKSYAIYCQRKIREAELEIRRMEVYFIAAEHYAEIMKWITELEDMQEYECMMQEKFNLSPNESRMIRYFKVNDFNKAQLASNREKLEDLKKNLEIYKKDC